MSKRNLSNQQSQRIKKNQQTYSNDHCYQGLVIKRFNRYYMVEEASNKLIRCAVRTNLEDIVAGDLVLYEKLNSAQGIIVSLCSRTNVLARLTEHEKLKPIAANISQCALVIAAKPEISWELLDSYLVMTEHLNFKCFILLNKTDLAHEEILLRLQDYQALNYLVVSIHQNDAVGYGKLAETLANQTTVLLGQSGMGKSTVINHLLPGINIPTTPLSELSELGCHTTRHSCLYHLPSSGNIIDSPGIRQFKLTQLTYRQLAYGYREFRPYSNQCKYRNCNHIDSSNCAIIDAVNRAKVSHFRYQNYCRNYQLYCK